MIANARPERTREAAGQLLAGVNTFYEQFPSLLCSPLDLRYVTVVLVEHVEHMAGWLTGTMPIWDETEDSHSRLPLPIDLTSPDVGMMGAERGLRQGQAYNFVLSRMGGLRGALESLISRCQERQGMTGVKVPIRPVHHVDLLFLVMAVDFALRPGQPARLLLDQWPDEYPGKSKPKPTRYEGPIE